MKRKKTVLISGNFNVLHAGHLRMFAYSKKYCQNLLVAVNSDKIAGKSAILNEKSRLQMVKNSNLVSKAVILRESISKFIKKNKPSYIVKGKEYESKYNKEAEILKKYGGKLIFSSGESIISSRDLIKKNFDKTNNQYLELPENYMQRHKISRDRLINLIEKFKSLRVLVIGDLILDEYISCQPLGMSQEDYSIVVNSIDNEYYLGGAGIVSAHVAGLGAKSSIMSVVGNDKYFSIIKKKLKFNNVINNLIIEPKRQTICKKRFRAEDKVLFRLSEITQSSISLLTQNKIIKELKKKIKKIDLLIFSDFNYGTLNQNLVNKIISICQKNKVMTAADSQTSSQFGDIARFKGVDLITPTEHEARVSTKNYDDGLVILIDKLRKLSKAKNIILKLGSDGLLIHKKIQKKQDLITDRIRSLNSSPKDIIGAGDAMLTTSALSLKLGANIWEASLLGSIAAGIQIGVKGNTPLKLREIINILEN